uniref:Oxygen sensor histidine kinase NreB n=1 Tax=uncultured Rubrobacteraceae bacterium TaxID=349277 RepID=A0A6J4QF77_9ACTN|nr:MAG: Sensor histidine kinase [uncultured Rubrobacteraceae bacterium]
MHVVRLWTPAFWLSASVQAVTVVASLGTALALPPLIPKVLDLARSAKVSEERRQRLQESEERFRSLVENLQVGVLLHGPQAEILLSNWTALNLLCLKEDQLVGKTYFDVDWNATHEDGSPFPIEEHPVPRAIASGRPVRNVVMSVCCSASEERVWLLVNAEPQLDADGSVRQVVCTFSDITERKRAEEALRESEQRFKSSFEDASIGMALVSIEGRWLQVNQSLCEIVGYSEEELLNKTFQDITHPDDLETDLGYVHQLLAGEVRTYQMEKRYLHKLGHTVWILLNGSLVRDEGGEPLYFIGQIQDITKRKEAEEEIRRLNETLEELVAERTARLVESERRLKDLVGKLVAAQEEERRRVAYEVHDGPTQVAIAAHQHLQAFADDHPPGSTVERGELDRTLELAQRAVVEARHIIENLRPTALDDFGLAVALRMRVEELEKEGWEIGHEDALGGERLPEEIETALYRIAQEALANVRKHARTTRARTRLARLGRKVRLEVRDEGRGFDPSSASRGGSPGERVGLSSMRERVAMLGGELKITSRPGAGTSLVAEVPLHEPEGDRP